MSPDSTFRDLTSQDRHLNSEVVQKESEYSDTELVYNFQRCLKCLLFYHLLFQYDIILSYFTLL